MHYRYKPIYRLTQNIQRFGNSIVYIYIYNRINNKYNIVYK